MIDLFLKTYDGIVKAFWETNYMMGISMVTVICNLYATRYSIIFT